jgi:hypothetical protein
MHNTLVLNGQEHTLPQGAFHWRTRADSRVLVARAGDSTDFVAGTHDGYAEHRHVRAVLAIHGTGWLIVDYGLLIVFLCDDRWNLRADKTVAIRFEMRGQ